MQLESSSSEQPLVPDAEDVLCLESILGGCHLCGHCSTLLSALSGGPWRSGSRVPHTSHELPDWTENSLPIAATDIVCSLPTGGLWGLTQQDTGGDPRQPFFLKSHRHSSGSHRPPVSHSFRTLLRTSIQNPRFGSLLDFLRETCSSFAPHRVAAAAHHWGPGKAVQGKVPPPPALPRLRPSRQQQPGHSLTQQGVSLQRGGSRFQMQRGQP